MVKFPYTTYLFAMPSFLRGVARLFDPLGRLNQYNVSDTPQEADYRALLADWKAVSEDIRQAMIDYQPILEKQKPHVGN